MGKRKTEANELDLDGVRVGTEGGRDVARVRAHEVVTVGSSRYERALLDAVLDHQRLEDEVVVELPTNVSSQRRCNDEKNTMVIP